MDKIKFGKMDDKKIKEVLSNGTFKTVAVSVVMTIAFSAAIAGLLSEEIKNNKIHKQISSIEYVTENEIINLEDLYIVEKDWTKHLCTREIFKEEEIFNSGQQVIIYKSTGVWVPSMHRDIYTYKDIRTKEYICTDKNLLNINISPVCDSIVQEIKNEEINIENIDSDYINSFVSNEIKKTK